MNPLFPPGSVYLILFSAVCEYFVATGYVDDRGVQGSRRRAAFWKAFVLATVFTFVAFRLGYEAL